MLCIFRAGLVRRAYEVNRIRDWKIAPLKGSQAVIRPGLLSIIFLKDEEEAKR